MAIIDVNVRTVKSDESNVPEVPGACNHVTRTEAHVQTSPLQSALVDSTHVWLTAIDGRRGSDLAFLAWTSQCGILPRHHPSVIEQSHVRFL